MYTSKLKYINMVHKHDFVVCSFVVVILTFLADSCNARSNKFRDSFNAIRAISRMRAMVWLLQHQWINHMGKFH